MAVAAVGKSYELEYDKSTGVLAVKQTYVVAVQQKNRAVPAPRPVEVPAPRPVAPIRTYQPVQTGHRKDKRCSTGNIVFAVFILALPFGYGAVTYLSAEMSYSCPDTRMALYTVIQGSFAMFNHGMIALWIMLRCVGYEPIVGISVLIFLFNLVWSIVGAVWIKESPCTETRLQWFAIGSSCPMWFVIVAFFVYCCCCRDSN